MKKILVAALGLLCATTLVVSAKDAKDAKANWSDQQKALWQQMVEKYDLNKDKELSKKEIAKISSADLEKLEKAGLLTPSPKKKAPKRNPATTGHASTNAPATPSHVPAPAPAPAPMPAPAPAAPAAPAAVQ